MRDENDKNINETDAAFALSISLTSFLLSVLLCAVIWIIYSALGENGELNIYLRGASRLYSL
ncbi:MAG TPA: hypothetical protein VIL74_24040 [Pyrinomonadaceae bacterium]|jgi:uncharacterized membrane protein (DUF106 family)